ncbi:hypothetical protein [Gluconobacter oxydans]|uniref:hypothetical protein n=1 Tax=Gluconobacter oxydans TaxID=442 RepID=UPI0034648082
MMNRYVAVIAALAIGPGFASAQSIPTLTPRVTLDAPTGLRPAFATKADVKNGKLDSPAITGGSLDGAQTITTTSGITQPLATLLGQQINVLNYGAVAGGTDSGTAVKNAIGAAVNRFPVYFPYSSYGYTINSGTYTGKEIGTWLLNGNRITGNAIGIPTAGTGTLISPYTNPYLTVTDRKSVYDPAGIPQGSNGTTVAESIECLPNRSNAQNANANRNWIACRYVGADTGTGGTSSIDLSTEVENWVLNVSGNHGLAFEIDTNFNAAVTDNQWTTGLFLTGGGAAGTNVNSVALSIMHSAYDGSWLPWTTGISIRETTDQIQQYKSSASEAGFFQQAFDETNTAVSWLDKMGNQTAQIINAKKGFVGSAPTGYDEFSATRQTSTDTGFFIRYFDENANTLASIDKSGGAVVAGLINTNHTGESSTSTCTRGEMHADDLNLYVCISTGKYKVVPLQAIQ